MCSYLRDFGNGEIAGQSERAEQVINGIVAYFRQRYLGSSDNDRLSKVLEEEGECAGL